MSILSLEWKHYKMLFCTFLPSSCSVTSHWYAETGHDRSIVLQKTTNATRLHLLLDCLARLRNTMEILLITKINLKSVALSLYLIHCELHQKIWVFEIQFIPLSSHSCSWWTNVTPTYMYLCCHLLTKMEIPTNTHAGNCTYLSVATIGKLQQWAFSTNQWKRMTDYTNGLWQQSIHNSKTLSHKLCSNCPRTLRT